VEALLSEGSAPQALLHQVKNHDMGALVARQWQGFTQRVLHKPEQARKALLCQSVAHFSERLRLNSQQDEVSLDVTRVSEAAQHLYSSSGYGIWFAPEGFDYELTLFRRQGDRLVEPQVVRVSAQAPVLVEGDAQVVDVCSPQSREHLVFSLNVPVPGSDIEVFDRRTLSRIAWFAADVQVSRFLMLLDALQVLEDSNLQQIADELLYHPHPAVRWQAFQVLVRLSPEQSEHYRERLMATADPGLSRLVSNFFVERRHGA